MKKIAIAVLILSLGAVASARAENYELGWSAVTKYSDGAALEAGKAVTYTVYWSDDPALAEASLKAIVSGTTATTATFNPMSAGMPRGASVYFACRATLNTGEVSDLSSAVSWPVPLVKPSSPRNPKIIRIP